MLNYLSNHFRPCLVLAQLLLLTACKNDQAELAPVHPKSYGLSDIQGSWIGWADGQDDLFFYRLTIESNTGALGQDFIGESTAVARIAELSVSRSVLSARLVVSGTNEIQAFCATISGGVIRGVVTAKNWQHKVTLHREARFNSRRAHLTQVMERGSATMR